MASEFELIKKYLARQPLQRPDVILGIGDDGAILDIPADERLVVTLDTLVAGVHFLDSDDPYDIGYKALAVNLSDLAAMGAQPRWVTLALTLPTGNAQWLEQFCTGLFELAALFNVQLVGGDMTRGPLTISLQAHGTVPPGLELRRSGAQPDDWIVVTGTPGDAGLALALACGQVTVPPAGSSDHQQALRQRLTRPTPRVLEGLTLRGQASAAIDISDGLAQDLGHILESSRVGATVWVDELPRSSAFAACIVAAGLDDETAIQTILTGGDDYELCFCIAPAHWETLRAFVATWECRCTIIGRVEAAPNVRWRYRDGQTYVLSRGGYDHFC